MTYPIFWGISNRQSLVSEVFPGKSVGLRAKLRLMTYDTFLLNFNILIECRVGTRPNCLLAFYDYTIMCYPCYNGYDRAFKLRSKHICNYINYIKYISIYLNINQGIVQSINQPTNQSINQIWRR